MKQITAHRPGGSYLFGMLQEERAMLSFDSYRDVLSEHAHGHHLVTSAWVLLAALAVILFLIA